MTISAQDQKTIDALMAQIPTGNVTSANVQDYFTQQNIGNILQDLQNNAENADPGSYDSNDWTPYTSILNNVVFSQPYAQALTDWQQKQPHSANATWVPMAVNQGGMYSANNGSMYNNGYWQEPPTINDRGGVFAGGMPVLMSALGMLAGPMLGALAPAADLGAAGIDAAMVGGQSVTPALMESAMGSAGYGASSASGLLGTAATGAGTLGAADALSSSSLPGISTPTASPVTDTSSGMLSNTPTADIPPSSTIPTPTSTPVTSPAGSNMDLTDFTTSLLSDTPPPVDVQVPYDYSSLVTDPTSNLTPAQIESMLGTPGYGASTAGAGGTGLDNTIANILGSSNPSEALKTALANTTGMDSTQIAGLNQLKSMLNAGTSATGSAKAATGTGTSLLNPDGSVNWSGLLTGAAGGTGGSNLLSLLTGGAGSYLNQQAATDAAKTQADAQIKAAQIAADAAKFKPVGVTTGFGSSNFGYDANGNLTSAGYQLTPQMQALQQQLLGSTGGLLNQAQNAQQQTAPMSQAAQTAMQLGQGYLSTDPQAQAQKYLNDQLNLLAPQRASDMAALQATMQAQGRGGFAMGGGVNGQGAANPQLQALLNAQSQQNTQLAANATQGGMDYAKFGAGMVGTGSDLLNSMYGTQTAAFNPYNTALQGASNIEGLGQNALTMGMNMGNTVTAANAKAGGLLSSGMTNAAGTIANTAQTVGSPWGNLLQGAGNMLSGYKYDPNTGVKL